MSYKGSYMWNLRQKAGNMTILTATVDILPIDQDGKVKLAHAPHVGGWSCIGGHVELGDSWSSAALNELREEGGIVADENNLTPFGVISGPQRIFHYQDGDTQPFTLCFVIKNWQSEGAQEDTEEITQSGWFEIDEALAMKITPWCKNILLGYKRFVETKEFQIIEDVRDNKTG